MLMTDSKIIKTPYHKKILIVDVNYVLGQKLVDKRQQTVVVDYRSQVNNDDMEYERLSYTQSSFVF